MLKRIFLWFTEHLNELIVGLLFTIIIYYLYDCKDDIFTKDDISKYIMPLVVLFGIFLTWFQFIFNKYNLKKEAAINYFPRPLELERIESEIDKVINFWSASESLDTPIVKLMLGKSITKVEYQVIWEKLSIDIKIDIIRKIKLCDNSPVNIDTLPYEQKYNVLIESIYVDTRRKLNGYLNQIEGYCLAINNGNIDSNAAKKLYAHKFKYHFKKAQGYIDMVRIDKQDKRLYIEFERVLDKWKD
ncbi:MAG: DUF4760 domain-containing protein [Sulfurimonas sp.]|nr:DUF4760 domain-containing protein [Sulfurimonas sp.]